MPVNLLQGCHPFFICPFQDLQIGHWIKEMFNLIAVFSDFYTIMSMSYFPEDIALYQTVSRQTTHDCPIFQFGTTEPRLLVLKAEFSKIGRDCSVLDCSVLCWWQVWVWFCQCRASGNRSCSLGGDPLPLPLSFCVMMLWSCARKVVGCERFGEGPPTYVLCCSVWWCCVRVVRASVVP